ncbi:hypothetical protein CJ030_MR6G018861 [Morella rubra]|uniref:Uncharacterized protein n=1 Tax=Morella rubra TaxID=262757 RepID=A0A6A1V9D8_9ROSI|nr:hypothetical protein CJ030_MR6G018861 [Morella rubra]
MREPKHKGNKRLKSGVERRSSRGRGRAHGVGRASSQPVSRRLQLLDELEASNEDEEEDDGEDKYLCRDPYLSKIAFIEVAEGEAAFKHEGYVLAGGDSCTATEWKILLYLHQDPNITHMAHTYLMFCLSDLLTNSFIHPIRIYLRARGTTHPFTLASLAWHGFPLAHELFTRL